MYIDVNIDMYTDVSCVFTLQQWREQCEWASKYRWLIEGSSTRCLKFVTKDL